MPRYNFTELIMRFGLLKKFILDLCLFLIINV
jgi:hypothetical protein